MHVAWDARAAVTVGIQCGTPGDAAERCVRRALGELHAPPGTAGDDVIVVRSP